MDYSQMPATADYSSMNSVTPEQAGMFAMFSGVWLIFWLIWVIAAIAGYWKTFQKAGYPGWAAIIPIYNIYVLIKVAKQPGWWVILYFIPIVNIIISIIVALDLAKVFGKSGVFGFFLNWLLQPIGPIIIGFGSAKYKK